MPERKLSDNELRQKLIELGVEVGPITDSTRKLYEKKLNELQTGNKKNRRRSAPLHPVHKNDTTRNSLIGFSSEESDLDVQNEHSSRRRRTMSPSQLNSSSSVNSREPDLIPNTSNAQEFKVPLPRHSKNSEDTQFNSSLKRSNLRSSKRLSLNHTSLELDTSDSDFDIDKRLSDLRKRRSLGSSLTEQSSVNSVNLSFAPSDSGTAKSKSGIKSGLGSSSSSSSLLSSSLLSSSKSSFLRGSSLLHANGQRKQMNENDLEWEFAGEEASGGLQNIPHMLVALVAVFFIIVGLLYVGVRQNDVHESSLTTSVFSEWLCKGLMQEECVPKEHLELALLATRHLHNLLSEKAGQHECDAVSYPQKYLSFLEAKRALFDIRDITDQNIANSVFDSCLLLMKKNPEWGLTILVNEARSEYGLESKTARKTLLCRIRQAFQRVFMQLCLALSVIIGTYGCFVYFNHRRQKKRIYETQLFELIEKIIDTLQQNEEDSFMPIVHVRDMLIPLAERNSKEKLKLWDAAVNFLESNESRIRTEHQRIAGEDFRVWRWLQPSSPYPSSVSTSSTMGDNETRRSKVWQGQAFGTKGKGGNVLPFCPTPCLKIRNMFDPDVEFGSDWPQYIRDAILEKCANTVGILHIHVDSTSKEGCVYVKCNAQETAGQVYRALHGWWFDGNLITVKYLRLERYHERFPDSRSAITLLKPSNNLQLSLLQLSHHKT